MTPFLTKLGFPIVVLTIGSSWVVSAQEFAYENMTGGAPAHSSSSAIPILAYGENPRVEFPPKLSTRARSSEVSGTTAYCVRACDGRYFPATDTKNSADGCKNLCPAADVQVFYGSSIEDAYSAKGKPYSSLSNAFRYRKELVDGCTCNGKDTAGLASIKVEDDRTLRRGDLVATEEGLKMVSNVVDGQARFASASSAGRAR
jgi:hypothetical protein